MTNAYTESLSWVDRDDADVDAFVRTYRRITSFDLREKLITWRRDGIVVFERAVDHDLIDAFLADVQLIRDHNHEFLIPIEISGEQTWTQAVHREAMDGPRVKFNHLHVSSLFAARLSLTREVTEFLEAIFESEVVPMQSLTFWMGSEQPTHIDFPYVFQQRRLARMAAAWIALEDIDPCAGPVAYYPGAHKPGVCGFFDWGQGDILCRPETRKRSPLEFSRYLDSKLQRAGIEPRMFLPRKGDVLIWHANMPHTGTLVTNPGLSRKSYVTHYTGLLDYPESWFPENLLASSIRENRGVVMDFPWSKPASKLPSWIGHFGKFAG